MKKVKPRPFHGKNGKVEYNASGVVEVGPRRFVFVDNRDPATLFEFAIDSDGAQVEEIQRRELVGPAQGQFGDPEGLARMDLNGHTFLVAASSLCIADGGRSGRVNDGLMRVRYRAHGDLHADAMPGFREWLLSELPGLAKAAERDPDSGGLNIEGVAWDPRSNALLFGLRGPASPGAITVIRVHVRPDAASWTTAVLDSPVVLDARVPWSDGTLGIRDISYDAHTGDFLILLGRSISHGDEPFHLCTWNGRSDTLELLDIKFHKSAKPEGLTTFTSGDGRRILVVDDCGGYAILDAIS